MGNNGIEDILIGRTSKKEKKKGRGFLVFLILLLICALAALLGIYYNLVNNQPFACDSLKDTDAC